MVPAVSQVCTLPAPFEQDIADFAAAACRTVELWLGKLEHYLDEHPLEAVRGVLDRHGVEAPVASYQGGLLDRHDAARGEQAAMLSRRLQYLSQLGVQTLVVAADVAEPVSQSTIDRVRRALAAAAREAEMFGIRLALEFQARSTLCNNLQTAAALVDEIGSPHLGLCLDAFHFFVGPSKTEDLGYLSGQNLFHVQLCDLADTARELACDSDRILPGDGDFPLQGVIEHLRLIDYRGCVSLELMNPQLWSASPLQVGEIGMTALRRLLGQASMEG
jgi:4-hydroxyphenylpyruvate dioxygenase